MSDQSRQTILEALEAALADHPAVPAPAFPVPAPKGAPARPDWPALAREITGNGGRFALARSAAEARGALAYQVKAFAVISGPCSGNIWPSPGWAWPRPWPRPGGGAPPRPGSGGIQGGPRRTANLGVTPAMR
jgi:hypothetical protein